MVIRRILAVVCAVLATAPALAAVEATVDRNVVEQNESFLLEVVVDGNTSSEPAISPLDRDFLENRAYPAMKEAAEFFLDFLVKEALAARASRCNRPCFW